MDFTSKIIYLFYFVSFTYFIYDINKNKLEIFFRNLRLKIDETTNKFLKKKFPQYFFCEDTDDENTDDEKTNDEEKKLKTFYYYNYST
jgi:hypothetical protein